VADLATVGGSNAWNRGAMYLIGDGGSLHRTDRVGGSAELVDGITGGEYTLFPTFSGSLFVWSRTNQGIYRISNDNTLYGTEPAKFVWTSSVPNNYEWVSKLLLLCENLHSL